MKKELEVEFYNTCSKIIKNLSALSDEGHDFHTSYLKNDIQGELKKITPKMLKNASQKKHLLSSLLVAYFIFKNFDLKNWVDFEKNIYPNLKKIRPELFTYKDFSRIRGDLLESSLIILINDIFNLKDVFAYSVGQSGGKSKLLSNGRQTPVLDQMTQSRILEKLYNEFKITGINVKKIWGDNDVLVISMKESKECFCVISCKSSLREREHFSLLFGQ